MTKKTNKEIIEAGFNKITIQLTEEQIAQNNARLEAEALKYFSEVIEPGIAKIPEEKIFERVTYLQKELEAYINLKLTNAERYTSGVVVASMRHEAPLWLERLIKTKIDTLLAIDNYKKTLGSNTSHEILASLKWAGDNKTEMSELAYCLWKSERITKNGKPLMKKEIVELFEAIFNTSIKDPEKLVQAKIEGKNTRGKIDKFFVDEISTHWTKYLEGR